MRVNSKYVTLVILATAAVFGLSRSITLAQSMRTSTSNSPSQRESAINLLPPLKPAIVSWPTMAYSNFMSGHPDEARRKELWDYFLVVERQAKNFARNQNEWKTLTSVSVGTTGAKWFSNGRIQLGANTAPGTMFHEVFHNSFNGSEFRGGEDNAWSEAFCDAFRYMMEKSLLPEPRSGWFSKVDGFTDMTYDQVMDRSGDKSFDRKYLYPASLIIRESGKDPSKFYALWFKLKDLRRQRNGDVLNAYFRYDMKNGRPLDR